MANDVVIGASMRANLLSLQKTNSLLDSTQYNLSTGKKVNSALDNPHSFFTAQGLNNRAADLGRLLDGMGQSIQTIKAADKAITAISSLLDQADGIAREAKDRLAAGAVVADLTDLAADFDEIVTQIDDLVADAHYRGINLLKGDDLETVFNEDGTSKATTDSVDFSDHTAGAGHLPLTAATAWTGAANEAAALTAVNASIDEVRTGVTAVRDFGVSISNSLSIIQTREEFTKQTMNVLNEGADKLTLADPNEEGAKMLALQTRLQLGVTSMSLAAQSQQSVLSLF